MKNSIFKGEMFIFNNSMSFLLFQRIDKRPQHDTRTIYIGNKLISNNEVEIPDQIYPDNRVISSKVS